MRACIRCGRPVAKGNRCALHRIPTRGRHYTQNARTIVVNASICGICGEGPRIDDPWVADHIKPRVHGGSDELDNLRAAHRSCNGRRGQAIGEWLR